MAQVALAKPGPSFLGTTRVKLTEAHGQLPEKPAGLPEASLLETPHLLFTALGSGIKSVLQAEH